MFQNVIIKLGLLIGINLYFVVVYEIIQAIFNQKRFLSNLHINVLSYVL